MRMSDAEFGGAADLIPAPATLHRDPVSRFIEVVLPPLRFLTVGTLVCYNGQTLFTFRPPASAAETHLKAAL